MKGRWRISDGRISQIEATRCRIQAGSVRWIHQDVRELTGQRRVGRLTAARTPAPRRCVDPATVPVAIVVILDLSKEADLIGRLTEKPNGRRCLVFTPRKHSQHAGRLPTRSPSGNLGKAASQPRTRDLKHSVARRPFHLLATFERVCWAACSLLPQAGTLTRPSSAHPGPRHPIFWGQACEKQRPLSLVSCQDRTSAGCAALSPSYLRRISPFCL